MSKKINFELVSPERKLFSDPVHMAIMPGHKGEIGVGADHAAFIIALNPGVVKLIRKHGGEVEEKIFISGGFADIDGIHCSILAEDAIKVEEIDVEALDQEIHDYRNKLAMAEETADIIRFQNRIEMAQAKRAAVSA